MTKFSFNGGTNSLTTTVLYTVPAGKIAKVKLRDSFNSVTNSISATINSGKIGSITSSFFVGEQLLHAVSAYNSGGGSVSSSSVTLAINDMLAVTATSIGTNNTQATIMNFLFNFDATNKAFEEAAAVKFNGLRYVGKNEFILFSGENIRIVVSSPDSVGTCYCTYDFYVYEDDVL